MTAIDTISELSAAGVSGTQAIADELTRRADDGRQVDRRGCLQALPRGPLAAARPLMASHTPSEFTGSMEGVISAITPWWSDASGKGRVHPMHPADTGQLTHSATSSFCIPREL